jgi:L-threonylcarbamoyladenylate synthase
MPDYILPSDAVHLLKNKKVVAIPTETVYGLAADATSKKAVGKIYKIKNRPKDNPLICHFYSIKQLSEWGFVLNNTEKKLLKKFSPGPISIKLKLPLYSKLIAATAGLTSIIVRIPSNRIFKGIIKNTNTPLAAPSANTSGKYSGTTAKMVWEDLGKKVDGIVDGGKCKHGLESTIIDASNEKKIKILRPGPIGVFELKQLLGDNVNVITVTKVTATPGSKYKHYAPIAQVNWFFYTNKLSIKPNSILLLTKEDIQKWKSLKHYDKNIPTMSLGSISMPDKISRNIYRKFFEIDQLGFDFIYLSNLSINSFSEKGSGKALVERLNKVMSN